MRHEFSKRTKRDAFTRCKGRCEGCTAILRPGHFDYDHDNPDAFGGSNELANCRVLCDGCHGKKTAQVDIPAIAKSNRIRKRQAGLKKPRTIRAWRKFNGERVFASRER